MHMKFDWEFLKNQVFEDSLLTQNRYPSKNNLPASAIKALEVREDGAVLLRIGAPEAGEVKVVAQFGTPTPEGYCPWEDEPVYGTKDENGIFTAVIPWGETHTGSRSLKIYIDGTLVIWPYLPTAFGSNRIQNFIEVPDEEMAFSYIYNVLHGAVISQRFHSSATGKEERMMIYTPPGYTKNNEDYPVLYLLHGGSDNETSWFARNRVNDIMDNLIAEGKCRPFIICAINDMYTYGEDSAERRWDHVDGCTEDVLIHDAIPFMEENYRVLADKWHRAIGGLSLGALQACDYGFGHPELFGNLGFLTSITEHATYRNLRGRPWKEALAHPEETAKQYKVLFCSATPQEDHFDYFLNDQKLMKEAGLEELMPGYHREVHPMRLTRWCSWRLGFRHFAEMLFREESDD